MSIVNPRRWEHARPRSWTRSAALRSARVKRLARLLLALAAGWAAGCSVAGGPSATPSQPAAMAPPHPAIAAGLPPGPWHPPAALADLARTPGVVFSYREELSHDHLTLPMWQTAFDPRTYAGHPLGYYQVTAFGSVAVTRGAQVLGDYTAQTRVEQPYTIYSGPTFIQLERRARARLRQTLDAKLIGDAGRLRAAASQAPSSAGVSQ